jgi:hypothetical protein
MSRFSIDNADIEAGVGVAIVCPLLEVYFIARYGILMLISVRLPELGVRFSLYCRPFSLGCPSGLGWAQILIIKTPKRREHR